MLVACLGGYLALEGPIWLLLVLALAPALSMAADLEGPRLGSMGDNLFHTHTLLIDVGAVGLWTGIGLAVLITLI